MNQFSMEYLRPPEQQRAPTKKEHNSKGLCSISCVYNLQRPFCPEGFFPNFNSTD